MTDLAPPPVAESVVGRLPVMADVARLAGVSHQTVSRVVNGQNNLRPATRARVEAAIAQLGYRPNNAARALVTRRSGTIGVVGTAGGFWGPSTVHRSVQAAGRGAGMFVSSVNLPRVTGSELADAVAHLRDQHVEGIVLIAANDHALETAARSTAQGVPVVVIEGDPARTPWTVGVDQHAGAVLATRHLLDLGHTEVVHVAGPQEWVEARGRLAGWQDTMHDAGLRTSRVVEGDWTPASGYRAGQEVLARGDATGVVVANDHMALGLLLALHEGGVSVPGDVSVVGFDDIPEAPYLIPPLTTVKQDFGTVGRRAIEILGAAIGGAHPADGPARTIPPTLVERRSTAAPRRSTP
ncbi:LacI family DNA-binding transcriptional regulator [uncultured Nocardioides sp.]|uniref:LacI family DNA-binding transcriptional regulator n=1 Tax=uncultured Nocardioides sp. TaxID=198441 RepID=UPI002618D1FD|nr:LacI family DNA-binding transcriptional regulator [uncultured Nocardioides sp.]